MNPNIEKLAVMAGKPSRMIIGLMSGTSLDGLDVALCRLEGHGPGTKAYIIQFESVPYEEEVRKEIRSVFSKREADLEKLCLLHPWIGRLHAGIVNDCLQHWGIRATDIDLLASHGQTVYHAPERSHGRQKFGNATLQIGDGDQLAVRTGIITLSDFRQKHIAAGGEGAPLAVYGDHLLFGKKGEDRILLNIGGIANFTYLPASRIPGEIISTDTGPGNTLMDAFIRQQVPGSLFDKDGNLASRGRVNPGLLEALKDHPFFKLPFPKTTGPELFHIGYLDQAMQESHSEGISTEDTMATLNRFTADTIAGAVLAQVKEPANLHLFLSGGGVHNLSLVKNLEEQLPGASIENLSSLGIDPDAKEALLFAVLANECICSDHKAIEKNIPGMPLVNMGKISFPF